MNHVGKYAVSPEVDDIELMRLVFELPERDKMVMWSEGYIDQVINQLPEYARDILQARMEKWEDTKVFYEKQLNEIVSGEDFNKKLKGERKEFALFVMERYPEYRSLLFLIYDGNLKDGDLRKFVFRRRFSSRKKYLY